MGGLTEAVFMSDTPPGVRLPIWDSDIRIILIVIIITALGEPAYALGIPIDHSTGRLGCAIDAVDIP
jgi:hypothetical protein